MSQAVAVARENAALAMSREITLIIKVTNACNMACKYCFIEPSIFHKTMVGATALRVIRVFLDSDWFETVHFVWHGGEPLLRGRGFFEDLMREQRRVPTKVAYTNSIQTNATRLTDELLAFLLQNDIAIGLSMDGPKELTDAARPLRNAASVSTHAITLNAADRLRAHGQAPAAIVVINRTNVDRPEDVYREFKERAIDMKLNPLARSGLAAVEGAAMDISAVEYGEFMVRMFDAWFDDPQPEITIEPIRQHIARILGIPGVVHACHFTRSCHRSFLGIAPDGELYPCGMFQGEKEFCYGNVHSMPAEEIATTALFGRIEEREARVLASCSKCAFFDLCYGGCMFHSLKNSGLFAEKDYYCAGYKRYFEHVLRRIHQDLRRAVTQFNV